MPSRIDKRIAALERLPKITGRVVEESEEVLTLSVGPSLLEIPKAAIKETRKEKGDERVVEVTLRKDAQVIQSVLTTPGKAKEVISAELLGALRIDELACNCNCNCNCDGNCNCNCNCNKVGQPLNPAMLVNTTGFQRPVAAAPGAR